jgi:hypothetical protein
MGVTSTKTLGEQLAQVLAEIGRLRSDISKLDEKIGPFDKRHTDLKGFDRGEAGSNTDSDDVFGRLTDIRDAIRGSEYHIGAMRAQLDDMAEHAPSRDAIKPYLKKRK